MHNDSNMMRLARGECGIVPTYVHDEVTLNGVPLKRYQIVYAKTNQKFEKAIAEGLAARIVDLSGDVLAWCDDSAPETQYEILIGDTVRSEILESSADSVISVRDSKLLLWGTNAYEVTLAQRDLLEALENSLIRGDGKIKYTGDTSAKKRTNVSLMSYNFYGFHAYQTRMDNICRVITKYMPDIISIQEPDLAMMELTHINLDGYYTYYNGRPRHGEDESNPPADAKGANSVAPILYNTVRYRLISADTKWMSDTPDVVSKYESSEYYRHFSYVELEDRVTGARFVVVNLHLQRRTAVEQMHIVFDHLNRKFNDVPVFLVGDFNSEADKPVLYQMREVAGFASAHDTAKKIRDGHNRIDWILYTKDCADANFYHCCTETYPDPDDRKGYYNGRTPSDHFAFYAEVEIETGKTVAHDWSEAAVWTPPVEQ